jgi:NADPH:quinone reductase-like Zn-dependent oxidoreductase
MANLACWQNEAGGKITVGPADMHTPGPGEILVRNEFIALSPIDWKDQR